MSRWVDWQRWSTIRPILLMAALAWAALAQAPAVTSVAGARFHVGDLAKACELYAKVFGLQEKAALGGIVRFQLNASHYLELSAAGSWASGNPLEVVVSGASKPMAALKDPNGHQLEFVQNPDMGSSSPDAASIS
jgi:hypothetical protein